MKRMFIGALSIFFFLFSTPVLAVKSGVNVKDVYIDSSAHYIENGRMYMDVQEFSKLTGATYVMDQDKHVVMIGGKSIAIQMKDGRATAPVRELAHIFPAVTVSWDPATKIVYVQGVPDDQVGPAPSQPSIPVMDIIQTNAGQKKTEIAKWVFIFSSTMFFVLVMAGVLCKVYQSELLIERRIHLFFKNSIQTVEENRVTKVYHTAPQGKFTKRVLLPVWMKLSHFMQDKVTISSQRILDHKLRDAGQPYGISALDFRLIQMLLTVGLFVLVFLLGLGGPNIGQGLVMALAAGAMGAIYPNVFLNTRKKRRVLLIQREMPDFFDMVTLAIEAGMGLDAAIANVCKRTRGPISEEFRRSIDDMRLGKSRREAFTDLRDRVDSELFQSVMRALIQADQLGNGISKVLRSQTQRIREKRREAAREQAMKVPVKMLIPMVLFIFPCIFIVILGPMVIKFMTEKLL